MRTKNTDNSVYVGNLDAQVDESLLYELMIQAAPVVSVHIPKDRISQQHQGYAFVEFSDPNHASYAQSLLSGTRLYGKGLKINRAGSADAHVGAELFVGNLDPLVDEKFLKDTFSVFGELISVQVARDEKGVSKGHAFVAFDSFDRADEAIAGINGQYLLNRPCTVQYAVKENHQHGSAAERMLEQEARKHGVAFSK